MSRGGSVWDGVDGMTMALIGGALLMIPFHGVLPTLAVLAGVGSGFMLLAVAKTNRR